METLHLAQKGTRKFAFPDVRLKWNAFDTGPSAITSVGPLLNAFLPTIRRAGPLTAVPATCARTGRRLRGCDP